MSKISPCLWFNSEAEEAADFYVSIFPNSRILTVQRNPIDAPGGKAGSVLFVDFVLDGERFMALNGGQTIEHTWAVSMVIDCKDQAEVDRYWDALGAGGKFEACGWLKDRYGLHWQIVPTDMKKYLGGSDPAGAERAMRAMMSMVKIDIAAIDAAYRGRAA